MKRIDDLKTDLVHIRVTADEKNLLENNSMKWNFRSISEYLRFLGLNCTNIQITTENKTNEKTNN